jgi:hypothetical protein
MENVLYEPVELTESELDEVAGGRITVVLRDVNLVVSEPETRITNDVNNSVSVRS